MRLVLFSALCVANVCGHLRRAAYFPDHLHVEPGVVAEFAIIAGLVICFYGFRLLRAMIFTSAVVLFGFLVSSALTKMFGLETWVLVATWISFVIIGTAGGCVALAYLPFGVFLVGTVLSYAITTSLPYLMLPIESSGVLDGAIIVSGGLLAWLLVRPFTIVASSFVGAILSVRGIGYFTGTYPTRAEINYFHSHGRAVYLTAIPTSWWILLAAMFAFTVCGLVKQCRDSDKVRGYSRIGQYTGRRALPSFPLA